MCLDRCAARECAAKSLLFTAHSMPLELLQVHFDCAGSLNLGVRGGCFDCALVVVPCAFSHMVVTFSWQAQEKPRAFVVQFRFFVTGSRDRSCFTSMCSFRGRRNTLDMAVIVEELIPTTHPYPAVHFPTALPSWTRRPQHPQPTPPSSKGRALLPPQSCSLYTTPDRTLPLPPSLECNCAHAR